MIVIDVKTTPNLHIELNNNSNSDGKLLLIWEDGKYGTPLHSDIISVGPNATFFSAVNKPLLFFDDNGVKFRVVDLKTHQTVLVKHIKRIDFFKEKRILYIAQNNNTGYGYAARSAIYQLITNGYTVEWKSVLPSGDHNQYVPCNEMEKAVDACRSNNLSEYDCTIVHYVPINIESILTHFNVDRTKPVYCSTVWETSVLPKTWVDNLNTYFDGVIVPSEFNRSTFRDSGVTTPLIVWSYDIFPITDTTVNYDIAAKCIMFADGTFSNDVKEIKHTLQKNTVYYNISQYTNRKNVDQTIHTFCSKFDINSRVTLLLKLHFRTFTESDKEIIKYKVKSIVSKFPDAPSVILCLEDISDDEINDLHKIGDVYFTLNRGEGFGLCSYTAKQYGNRVICGGYGAEKEFLDYKDTIIPYKLEKTSGMIGFHNWYEGENQLWASFDNNEVVRYLNYYSKRKN